MQSENLMIGLIALVAAPLSQPITDPVSKPATHGISKRPMPRFPFLRWPSSVVPEKPPVGEAIGHFRFWDGRSLQDVEGRAYLATLVHADGRQFDAPLLQRMFEDELKAMGAVRIASGRVPLSAIATINDGDKEALRPGLGDIRNDPVQTWIIHRSNRQIWFQFTSNDARTSLAVVETKPN